MFLQLLGWIIKGTQRGGFKKNKALIEETMGNVLVYVTYVKMVYSLDSLLIFNRNLIS